MKGKYVAGEYMIWGFFWRLKPRQDDPYSFTGRIRLKADGSFEGETKDQFGKATIKGGIDETLLSPLCFTKEYLPGATGGGTKPIRYLFETIKHPANGGWRGTCTVQQPKDNTETIWNAVCVIFSLR